MGDVGLAACDEVIDCDYFAALRQQAVAEVRSKKSRSTGHHRAHSALLQILQRNASKHFDTYRQGLIREVESGRMDRRNVTKPQPEHGPRRMLKVKGKVL